MGIYKLIRWALVLALALVSPANAQTLHGVSDSLTGVGSCAPPSITLDGSVNNAAVASSVAVTLTTTKANDVVVVFIETNQNYNTITSVSSPTLGNFTIRAQVNNASPFGMMEWYATSVGILTGEVITVSMSSSAFTSVTAFGVNGAKLSAPYDLGVGLPVTGSSDPITVSTLSSNTMVIGSFSSASASATAGAGYTGIALNANFHLAEYQIFSSQQTGRSVTMGTGAGTADRAIGDALAANNACAGVNPPTLGFFVAESLAGADFGGGPFWPTNAELDYLNSKNIKTVRLPFKWEVIQPTLNAALDSTALSTIDGLLTHAAANGQKILLDVHSFAQYNGNLIGSVSVPISSFVDLWTRMATHYVGNSAVYGYELMNEPCCGISLATWQSAAQQATTAIRGVDASTLIAVDGIGFSSAPQWQQNNSTLAVTDPSNKLVYDPHSYADSDNSGTYIYPYPVDGATSTTMVTRMANPQNWAASLNFTVYHGEGGVPYYDPNWLTVLDTFLSSMQSAGEPVMLWAGGPAWGATYELSLEPKSTFMGVTIPASGTRDVAQMAVVTKYTGAAQPTKYFLGGPAQGPVSLASANFTVQYFGNLVSSVTVTPSDGGGGGTFSPTTITLASGTFNPTGNFTYTPASTGSKTISVTNSGTLTNPASQTFTSVTTSGVSAFEEMSGTVGFAWAPFKLISTYSATGNSFTALRSSDSTSMTFALSGGALDQTAVTTFCGAYSAGVTANGCTVTHLYDQSGNANDGVLVGGRGGPVPHVNGKNSLMTLHWATNPDTCLGTPFALSNRGATLFMIAQPTVNNDAYAIAMAGNIYYPDVIGTLQLSWINTRAPAGLTDTTAFHSDAAVIGVGDFPTSTLTYVDGSQISAYPSIDFTGGSSTMDIGCFRQASPAAFSGEIGQVVAVLGAASTGDISRAHSADVSKWATP